MSRLNYYPSKELKGYTKIRGSLAANKFGVKLRLYFTVHINYTAKENVPIHFSKNINVLPNKLKKKTVTPIYIWNKAEFNCFLLSKMKICKFRLSNYASY